MIMRHFIALMATVALIFALAACGGGGGGKASQTKTPTTKTPSVTGTVTVGSTAAASGTPGAAAPTTQDAPDGSGETPSQSDGPVIRPTRIPGEQADYRVQFTVASDPGNLQPLVESDDRFSSGLAVVIGAGAISFRGDQPFIAVGGTIDASGAFSATGLGRIDPYQNVEATFQGTIVDGQLTGTYAIGTNGALPGSQPITYNITGTILESRERTPTPGA